MANPHAANSAFVPVRIVVSPGVSLYGFTELDPAQPAYRQCDPFCS
jgi:hypothetical protein